MSKDDWYRNKEWNRKIADAYFSKLKRARKKDQYIRIQACYLTEKHPRIALELLEMFFELKEPFDYSQAYCDRASALISLHRIDEALEAYKSALAQERTGNGVQTEAYIHIPMLIAEHNIRSEFPFGKQILNEFVSRLTFPVDHFRWNAAMAIFVDELGNRESSSKYANLALEVAQVKKSGFTYHQNLGLVGKKYKKTIKRLRRIIKN